MESNSQTRAHVYISGRVQGVNFRYSTVQQARDRGLDGWVRNLPDGRVEAVFEGGEGDVEAVVEWCHQGPPAAYVEDVEVNWEQPSGSLDGFNVRM